MVRRIIPLVEDVVSRSAFGFFRFRSVCFSLCSLVPLCVACLLPLPKKEYFLSVEDTLSSIFFCIICANPLFLKYRITVKTMPLVSENSEIPALH